MQFLVTWRMVRILALMPYFGVDVNIHSVHPLATENQDSRWGWTYILSLPGYGYDLLISLRTMNGLLLGANHPTKRYIWRIGIEKKLPTSQKMQG